ncbi:hypothetical protein PIB30_001720 [Stylosanthes scabra]|uniref:Uncharacterized protein n=1 Tax=Stylosanthes scabra TaxID=79078 RepID=A0ABU6U5F5_9FABA|nr:hypothetical protein [Stylosanthes scabra]
MVVTHLRDPSAFHRRDSSFGSCSIPTRRRGLNLWQRQLAATGTTDQQGFHGVSVEEAWWMNDTAKEAMDPAEAPDGMTFGKKVLSTLGLYPRSCYSPFRNGSGFGLLLGIG